jgi:sensor histidine kinase YesM
MVLNNIHHIDVLHYEVMEWILYFGVVFCLIGINVFVFVPRYLLRNRPIAYFVRILILSFFLLVILACMQYYIVSPTEEIQKEMRAFVFLNFISSLISLGFLVTGTSSVMLLRHWIKSNRRINELESATLRSELNMLKNQINPHFLLNMLNNANVLIWKNKDESRLILYKLETMLRYQLNESYKEKVLLSFDIRFLADYLNLEKIRRDSFEFVIEERGNMEGIWVPPLLFIPFVENAVKHNNDSKQTSHVRLYFNIKGNKLDFCCENSKPVENAVRKKAGGIGLQNIKRRLALLYPDGHVLEINDEKTKYIVKLTLFFNGD